MSLICVLLQHLLNWSLCHMMFIVFGQITMRYGVPHYFLVTFFSVLFIVVHCSSHTVGHSQWCHQEIVTTAGKACKRLENFYLFNFFVIHLYLNKYINITDYSDYSMFEKVPSSLPVLRSKGSWHVTLVSVLTLLLYSPVKLYVSEQHLKYICAARAQCENAHTWHDCECAYISSEYDITW